MAGRRLIPTCVGSTPQTLISSSEVSAHPHVCGEHCSKSSFWVRSCGSSPRVWGAPNQRLHRYHAGRLIPTCVGSTLSNIRVAVRFAAHPHVCGEHAHAAAISSVGVGSSPRVWGAQHVPVFVAAEHRLIPTCVGSTVGAVDAVFKGSAHPHVCGEHLGEGVEAPAGSGSSPRVWGALSPRRARYPDRWLIPTCVGSTRISRLPLRRVAAHPHVCGEHFRRRGVHSAQHGSSPRVWGALIAYSAKSFQVRLIPTCVGSTKFSRISLACRAAHPHVCGEHSPAPGTPIRSTGSSPRVWGAPG